MTAIAPRPSTRTAERLGVLADIAERRRADVAAELADRALADLGRDAALAPAPRDALGPLLRPGLHVIAEVKRRSPSAGALASPETDVVSRARAYVAGGASIVSVLVEPHWFGGTIDDLAAVRAAVTVPVLAKEFVVDRRQLPVLRAAGADLVLLLSALHQTRPLRSLVRAARDLGMEPLVEAHDPRELDRALASDARLIGLNNRDLRTLLVDPDHAVRLRASVPDDRLVVAESGVREVATVAGWRAVGFDAALIGEALMTTGDDPIAIRARTAAFVAAGRPPSAAEDPAAADRTPFVKICGVTDVPGAMAAVRAGADAIGLNFAPATPRVLDERTAATIIAAVRAAASPPPLVVGVVVDRDPDDANALARRLDLDALQLHGSEGPETIRRLERPVWKVLHLPPECADDAVATVAEAAAATVERARSYLAAGAARIMIDTAGGPFPGGTGRRAARQLAAAVAREVPVMLAGGLDPANVAGALVATPALGVDVAGGVERRARDGTIVRDRRDGRPRKDAFKVGLFVKRAKAARLDRPLSDARPTPVHRGLLDVDARGRWGVEGEFGGRYVPETLVGALVALEHAWDGVRDDPRFWAELRQLRTDYVGGPSPLYRADRLAAALERAADRPIGHLRLYLKREDLNHTGAHKITNALGQALLTRRLGKTRVIAETGAGQHGVATATACALLDLPCVVYMGIEDVRRQAPNVLRMHELGAEVREVTSGSATLKDAINEAMRDWVTNVETTHYVLGSAVGPHPYPRMVRDLQRVIGDDAATQLRWVEGRLPDVAVACVGGGSNAIGLLSRFIGEPDVRLIGVEAAGEGVSTGHHAAALAGGSPGVLHGSRSYLLQDRDGQVIEAHSISAGLDYPGIGPQLSALYVAGRLEVLDATDSEAIEALRLVTRTEGIIPALEPSHAVAALGKLVGGLRGHALVPDDAVVLLGLSGRGDKDLGVLEGEG
ncbi:MAG: tryptophan synthase subunit beta [Candidatus Limnocylindrales bacterium]